VYPIFLYGTMNYGVLLQQATDTKGKKKVYTGLVAEKVDPDADRFGPKKGEVQLTCTVVGFQKAPTGKDKKALPPRVQCVITKASMDAALAMVKEGDAATSYNSVTEGGKLVLGGQYYGPKNYRTKLASFKGDAVALRAFCLSIPPIVLGTGEVFSLPMFKAKQLDCLDDWENQYPICSLVNVHGNTYDPIKADQVQRTDCRVSGIVVDANSAIPVQWRSPFSPKSGQYGDYAVPKFLREPASSAYRHIHIPFWSSTSSNDLSVLQVLSTYQPHEGHRSVMHMATGVPGCKFYIPEKQVDDIDKRGFQTWLQLPILRTEDAVAPQKGKSFEPNDSAACFGIELRFPADVIGPVLGITDFGWFQTLMSVHAPSGIVTARLNQNATAELNISSVIQSTGQILALPLLEGNQPKNGLFAAYADSFAPLLPLYLRDNGIPISPATAKACMPTVRPATTAYMPLSKPNKLGVASLNEWMDVDTLVGMAAGQANRNVSNVKYYALATKVVKDTTKGPMGSRPEPWTKEQLVAFSKMTPEMGDQYLKENPSVVYYAYAVTDSAQAIRPEEAWVKRLGSSYGRGDVIPPLYPDECDVAPMDDDGGDGQIAPAGENADEAMTPVLAHPSPEKDEDDPVPEFSCGQEVEVEVAEEEDESAPPAAEGKRGRGKGKGAKLPVPAPRTKKSKTGGE